MGKYEPLEQYLREHRADRWMATFAEIEAVIGAPLPPSAHEYREWWANQRGDGHSQAKGWQAAGWQVWGVDLDKKIVEFRQKKKQADDRGDEALFAQAADYLGTNDRATVIREALRALVAREAGRRLIRLGGTMPDLKIPPRDRPSL